MNQTLVGTEILPDRYSVIIMTDNIKESAYPIPEIKKLEACLKSTLMLLDIESCEVNVKITGESESSKLNLQFRGFDKPTNVLSFPCDQTDETGLRLLGDILVCHPVVAKESEQQGKSLEAHYAHMCVHGLMHLLGYDHVQPLDAEVMEKMEIEILVELGFDDPYGKER